MLFPALKSIWLVVVAGVEFFRAVVNFHAIMCWSFISWTVSITTLPVRALAALLRERTMETLLLEMQSELDNLSLDNEKLKARLQMAVLQHREMQSMLSEVEEEHDMVIKQVEVLEREVERLKQENLRLRESNTKGLWDVRRKKNAGDESISGADSIYDRKSSKTSELLDDPKIDKRPYVDEVRASAGVNHTGLVDPLTPLVFSSNVVTDAALYQRREVALFQSLFSALLSLLVGVVIWEAKDPCMPLVMALFSVVGLSLRSVVQFFSTIKNRPASDAVALLSFNWFILGTLTYPALPKVARMVSPIVVAFLEPGLSRMF